MTKSNATIIPSSKFLPRKTHSTSKDTNQNNQEKKFNQRKGPITFSYEFYPPTHLVENIKTSDQNIQKKTYPFHIADKKEIQKIRFHMLPAIILKIENIFYVANVPKNTEIVPGQFLSNYDHACSFCNRCSAAPDQKGGCIKVRDFNWKTNAKTYGLFVQPLLPKDFPTQEQYEAYKIERKKDFIKSIIEGRRIEKYSFIDYAVEGVNLKRDFFFIIKCNHLVFITKNDKT